MLLATDLCKLPSKNGYKDYKWPKVTEAFAFLFPDHEYTELHRGADDAIHEAMIVHKLFTMGIFKVPGIDSPEINFLTT
jgi:DNA polymerase-3 subunit epsilon